MQLKYGAFRVSSCVEMVELNRLLAESDYVSLHLQLNEDTIVILSAAKRLAFYRPHFAKDGSETGFGMPFGAWLVYCPGSPRC